MLLKHVIEKKLWLKDVVERCSKMLFKDVVERCSWENLWLKDVVKKYCSKMLLKDVVERCCWKMFLEEVVIIGTGVAWIGVVFRT